MQDAGDTKAGGGRRGEGEDEDGGGGREVKQSTRSGQTLCFRVKLSSHYHTARSTWCVCGYASRLHWGG